jgi:tight adherence protein B
MMPALLNLASADPAILSALVFGGSLAAICALAALWTIVFHQDERRLQRRIERIRSPRRSADDDPSQAVGSLRRRKKDSSIASLDRLIKRSLPNIKMMRLQLERSGLPLNVGDYFLICFGLGALTALALGFALDLSILFNVLVGVIVGLGVPHLIVTQRTRRRIRRFTMLLPEALELIVRGIRSGLPAAEAINTIGAEIEDPVGIEFRLVSDQVKIGVPTDEALWAVARRLQIPEFNFLVISLAIQQETGGNLAEILEKLSDMVRRREQMRLKIKAMSSEARASAMIIGSLPFIMAGVISFVNPGYMSTLFTDPRGWVMIGIGLTSLTIGLGVMAKMVRFEI